MIVKSGDFCFEIYGDDDVTIELHPSIEESLLPAPAEVYVGKYHVTGVDLTYDDLYFSSRRVIAA